MSKTPRIMADRSRRNSNSHTFERTVRNPSVRDGQTPDRTSYRIYNDGNGNVRVVEETFVYRQGPPDSPRRREPASPRSPRSPRVNRTPRVPSRSPSLPARQPSPPIEKTSTRRTKRISTWLEDLPPEDDFVSEVGVPERTARKREPTAPPRRERESRSGTDVKGKGRADSPEPERYRPQNPEPHHGSPKGKGKEREYSPEPIPRRTQPPGPYRRDIYRLHGKDWKWDDDSLEAFERRRRAPTPDFVPERPRQERIRVEPQRPTPERHETYKVRYVYR